MPFLVELLLVLFSALAPREFFSFFVVTNSNFNLIHGNGGGGAVVVVVVVVVVALKFLSYVKSYPFK